jgi:hypothetical protein
MDAVINKVIHHLSFILTAQSWSGFSLLCLFAVVLRCELTCDCEEDLLQ